MKLHFYFKYLDVQKKKPHFPKTCSEYSKKQNKINILFNSTRIELKSFGVRDSCLK